MARTARTVTDKERLERDAISQTLLKKMKPAENGRLEVAWRVYDAICHICQADLRDEQKALIGIEREAAYKRYDTESKLVDQDCLQGRRGFAAIRKEHNRNMDKKWGKRPV